jgi:hypothetical protein
MSIVLCHVGNQVPDYLNDCIAQIRTFTDLPIFVAANNYISTLSDVTVIPTYDLDSYSLVDEMHRLPFKRHEPNPLWRTAALRFGYIAALADHFQLEDIIHFDNDVLLYCDPKELFSKLREGRDIAITPCNEDLLICGFVYVRNWCTLGALTAYLCDKMREVDDNEMRLLRLIADDYPELFDMLPLMPSCTRHKDFGGVFDCASWGQWIGGTHQNPGITWAGDHHYVGRALNSRALGTAWDEDADGRRFPVCIGGGGLRVPIFNLHIHSKELHKYVS